MASITADRDGAPRITITVGSDGTFVGVCEVTDLVPTRTLSLEEQAKGWTSFDPPTVRVKTTRELIRELSRCTLEAAADFKGGSLTPRQCVCLVYRVTSQTRRALMRLGYEV